MYAGRFGSREQTALVCRTLLRSVDLQDCWTPAGPQPGASAAPCSAATPDARRLFAACWAIWEGCTTLGFHEVLALDSRRLDLVGGMLSALASGPTAVDAWLRERASEE